VARVVTRCRLEALRSTSCLQFSFSGVVAGLKPAAFDWRRGGAGLATKSEGACRFAAGAYE
jgi:hypothetical protein